MYRNRRYAEKYVQTEGVSREMIDVLFCPETSGGLLISVAHGDAQHLLAALQANEHTANSCVVGYMEKQDTRNKDATYIVLQYVYISCVLVYVQIRVGVFNGRFTRNFVR